MRTLKYLGQAIQILRSVTSDREIKHDANETQSFARSLEYIETQVYKIEYPELRARDFLPVNTRVPSGAQSFTYRIWDWFGMAKIIANGANDLPRVSVLATEKAQIIRSLGDSFHYTIQDIRSAAMQGTALETELAAASRRAFENAVDQIAAVGDDDSGLPGFLNNPNVPILTAADLVGDWLNPATTPEEILADLNLIAYTVNSQTKRAYSADTLLLPPEHFNRIWTTPWSTTGNPTMIGRVFLDNSPYIKTVDQWDFLSTADAAGTGPRAAAYKKAPEVVELVIPQEFEMLPPQARDLGFTVPCHGRIGGVVMRHPLGAVFADDI